MTEQSQSAQRLNRLLEVVGEEDAKELKLAHNGRIQTLKDYQAKPGRETKTDYDAAREFYDETIDRLWAIYFPDDPGKEPKGERFKNRKQAYDWIIANHGNIVSIGKFHQDCANGFPRVFDDKTVSKFSVLEYVLKLREKTGAVVNDAVSADLSARKVKAETETAENNARLSGVKADEAERERDARWMLREDHEDDMAAFAGLCEDTFRHRVYLDHQQLLSAAGGRPERASEFALALQDFCDRAFNNVADYKEIDVEFADEDDE